MLMLNMADLRAALATEDPSDRTGRIVKLGASSEKVTVVEMHNSAWVFKRAGRNHWTCGCAEYDPAEFYVGPALPDSDLQGGQIDGVCISTGTPIKKECVEWYYLTSFPVKS